MFPNSAIPVGLARTDPTYAGLRPPYGPGKAMPELADLLGTEGADEPSNHGYAAVRAARWSLGLDAENFGGTDWNPLGALCACRVPQRPLVAFVFCVNGLLLGATCFGAALSAVRFLHPLAFGCILGIGVLTDGLARRARPGGAS